MMCRKYSYFLILFCVASFSGAAKAVDFNWVGNDPKDPTGWNNPNNWSPTGIPGKADRAFIQRGGIVDLGTDAEVDSATLDEASTLGGAGTLTVTRSFKATDATLDGTGTLNLVNGCKSEFDTLTSGTGIKNNAKRPITNHGKSYLSGGDLILSANFVNGPDGEFYAASDGAITWNGKARPKFSNQGKFLKSNGEGVSTITATFTNTGSILVQTGTLDVGPDFAQTAGRTSLGGGELMSSSALQFQGGLIDGTGIIRGNVTNTGARLAPGHSPGAITILGNYTQTANGTLDMQIAGVNPGTQYDQISVQGTATLAGDLNITLLNGFQPSVGDSFTLLEYLSCVGSFSKIIGTTVGGKNYLKTSYTPSYFLATTNVDNKVPTVSIASPTAGLFSGQFPVTGTVADAESGVSSVTVRLARSASSSFPAGYWNGTTWDAVYNPATHQRKATGTAPWTLGLPKLPSGKYSVVATATDAVLNSAVPSTINFQVDNTPPPTLTCTNPVAGSFLTKFTPFKGTAADDTDGSGLAKVDVFLRRISDSKYWNGSAWGAKTALTTTMSIGTWNTISALPTGANLVDGNYEVTASAVDKAGLITSLAVPVIVDATAPSGVIKTPLANAILTNLPTATGTATDNFSGLGSLTLRLSRASAPGVTAGYWNGSSWGATYSAASHELTVTGTTSWSRAMPSGANVADTKYTLRLTVKDKSGNSATVSSDVWVDSKAPATVTIDAPVDGSFLTKFPAVSGTAADAAGGQGLARVDLQLRRLSNSQYWNGAAWQTGAIQLKTKLPGTTWTLDTAANALPVAGNLPDGAYAFTATAYDKANLSKAAVSTVMVDAALPKVTVTSPTNNSSFPQLALLQGTASDATSGLARVSVRLYRYNSPAGAAGYWNGSTWDATYSAALNENTTTGTTAWNFALPALTEGKFYCIATAYDKCGNKVSSPTITFWIDGTAPLISFVSPASGAQVKALPPLSGNASDGLAGIATVTLKIKRFDGVYWNGSAWVAAATLNGSYTSSSSTWNYGGALPTGSNLPEGNYLLSVTGLDKAGNSATANATVTVDKTVPSVTLVSPTATVYPSLNQISGTAADGVGLSLVTVRLSRSAFGGNPAGYWNGTSWNATYDPAVNDLPADGLESWVLDLPALADGKYTVRATAKDCADNSTSSASVSFTVTSAAPATASTRSW